MVANVNVKTVSYTMITIKSLQYIFQKINLDKRHVTTSAVTIALIA